MDRRGVGVIRSRGGPGRALSPSYPRMTGAIVFAVLSVAACGEAGQKRAIDVEAGHDAGRMLPMVGPMLDASLVRDAGAQADADDDAAVRDDAGADIGDVEPTFAWNLPPWMPEPLVPEDNPMSVVKVELGRHLFYDRRLSGNETQGCATSRGWPQVSIAVATIRTNSSGSGTSLPSIRPGPLYLLSATLRLR
jgi:hypothetical protein